MSYSFRELSPERAALLNSHGGDPGVYVRASTVRAMRGNGNAAILLNQFIYWSARTTDPEGWFYNTQQELEEQTGIGFESQHTARKLMRNLGILEEEKRGLPAKLYYRLDLDALAELLIEFSKREALDKNPGTPDTGQYRKNEPFLDEKQESATESVATVSGNPRNKNPGTPDTVIGASPRLESGNPGYIKDSLIDSKETTEEKKTAAASEIDEEEALRLKAERRFPSAARLLKDKLNNRADADGEGVYYSCLLEDPTRIAWLTLEPDSIRELIKQATSAYRGGAKFKDELIRRLDTATLELRRPTSASAEVPPPEPLSLEERKKISQEATSHLPPALRKALEARGIHSVN